MAEFKLGRIRFVWKNDWVTGTTYYKDDIVAYGGKTYLCVTGHAAAADFYTDLDNVPTKWNQFSDGQVWKGDWQDGATLYKENDIVKYGGYIYICNNGHLSQATLELDQSSWDLFAESFNWTSDWTAGEVYKINDVVKYGGYSYICNAPHTAAATNALGLEDDQSSWDIFSKGFDWKGVWVASTRYKVGDVVKYGGQTYVCNSHHTSASTVALGLEDDQSSWDYYNRGFEFKGQWIGPTTVTGSIAGTVLTTTAGNPAVGQLLTGGALVNTSIIDGLATSWTLDVNCGTVASATYTATVRYKINDLVKQGAGVWICIADHTSTSSWTTDKTNWAQYVEGIEFENNWSASGIYQNGDIVRYGGNSYIAKTSHDASALTPPSSNTTDWDLFSTGFRFAREWDSSEFRIGEVTRLGGFTYLATADSTNQKPPNLAYWTKLNDGIKWIGTWTNGTTYVLGDTVKYGPISYICIAAHIGATGVNRPDIDTLGTYWNALTVGNEESVLTTTGDLVYYSGAGPTRLPIGDEGQVLTVEQGQPAWSYFGRTKKTYYVAGHGSNEPAPTFGLTIDQPWASVRYAIEQITAGTENPNAGYLLNINRTFIQREITEWVKYQITAGTGIWAGFVNDSQALCERDIGLIVDAIVYDLTHTGNEKTIEATETYFTALGALQSFISDEEEQLVAAINYTSTLITNVLANSAPAANYQTLNGISVGSRIKQIIDVTRTSEAGTTEICTGLASVITSALTAGNLDGMPVLDAAGYTLNVKTGQYYEVLPIVLPPQTAIVGDELRGTRMSPAGKLIATNDKAKSLAALAHIRTFTDEIITNVAVTPTTGNTETQDTTSQIAGDVGSATALASVIANAAEIKDIVTNNTPNAYVLPTPTGGTGNAFTAGYLNAARLINANKAFLVDEVSEWILAQIAGSVSPFVGFTYTGTRRTKCERDVGLIIDALRYDLTYGGNLASQIAARSYYSFGVFLEPAIEKAPALAVQLRIKDIIDNIATGNTAGWTKTTALTQDVSGTAGSAPAATAAQARIQEIYDTINTGTEPTTIAPDITWPAAALVTARTTINSARAQIQSDAVQFVKRRFPTLNFDVALCSRDVGYMVDALGYDLMFGSNFLSIQSGLSYRRGITSTEVVITTQLAAQQAVIDFIGLTVSEIASSGAVVFADLLWSYIIGIVDTGGIPVNTGSNFPTTNLNMINGANILRLNQNFIAAEATAYINNTYKSTVTASTGAGTDEFICSSTAWMVVGDTIRFTGTTFGGVTTVDTYYVHSIPVSGTFKIAASLGGAALDLNTDTGTMIVIYDYDATRCQNDVKRYIQAIADDMTYTGNYHSVLASRYYRNALTGSKLEDMFYVSNGCGLRNCTLTGLDGSSDGNTTGYQSALLPANELGTQRPRAGAYVSLNPGWGPNDTFAWVTNKSTYVQNVTTFGTGCVGQKIDGALHAGGNDSIVSNDFTQVLSDGIGAWITNLGRAELVSVFSYYNYIGYLSENGGKIRATNGNNSYGTFGAVAEGVDVTEVPVLGVINNRNTEADIRNVLTDGDRVLAYEFGNAGSEYSSATITTSGAGVSAATVANEFRDNAVFQVRLTDPGDSTGAGGAGYISQTNAAQSGDTTSISLAVADNAGSAAYVGMSIYLVSGTGAGQYGYIQAYNSATKLATVYNESTGAAGWEHVIYGTPIVATLDTTTTYEITPRLSFTAPSYASSAKTLPSSVAWTDVVYGNGEGSYTAVTGTVSGGSGILGSFDITRINGVYTATINIPGILYSAGETITILGTSLGGTTPANDLVITLTSVSTGTGAILAISAAGTAVTPKFIAIAAGSASAAYSLDGDTWTDLTLPSSLTYVGVSYGVFSGVGYYTAIASGTTTAYYSTNGLNWSTASITSTTWTDVSYGNGRFMAIASGGTVAAYSITGGAIWVNTSALPASTTWTSVAYGGGVWVAVASGGTQAASSTNGTTWATRTLPSSGTWNSVTFGNNLFVAVRSGSTAYATSINGTTWVARTLPASLANAKIAYGQGVYFAIGDGSTTAYSSDTGITDTWTSRTIAGAANPKAITFGNPGGIGVWATVATGTTTIAAYTTTGARTKARAYVSSNIITEIWIREPGSGYTSAPTMTITDPNNTGADATYVARLGDGALGQPMFTNRGTGYTAASGTVSGNGYADNYQVGSFVGFKNLDSVPKPGSNVQIAGIDDVWYRLVTVTSLIPNVDGTYNASLQLSPPVGVAEAPEHETGAIIRLRYSQVRLTGHDFLDIGTGDFTNTNYPGLPFNDPIPANETVGSNGGRVFFTSTDQDGNFRVGGLFNVEQATGIATLNADAFNIAGLNELSLGTLALGGQGATITEFSTDPFFTQDSDGVIPTQRAIKAYINSQIGGGTGSVQVNTVLAGLVYIAGQTITTSSNVALNINTKVNFTRGVVGDALVLNYFLLNN
jgi:hypothetical protein